MKLSWTISSLLFLFLCSSCEEEPKKKPLPFKNKKEYEQTMILSHQAFLQKEKKRIDSFVVQSGYEFTKTGTGLRYSILKENEGDSLKQGEIAIIRYLLKSLEGDTLYFTKENEVQEFVVDFDDIEKGLHEGIKRMRTGEEAIMILPAHLAHGVTGDQALIPSQTTLVYEIELLAKR